MSTATKKTSATFNLHERVELSALDLECLLMHPTILDILGRTNGICRNTLRGALNTAFVGDHQLDLLLQAMCVAGEVFAINDKYFLNT